ncbi:T9SS type A sorting domain-containing protein [Crocinitomix catalasitica]|nr:T9SS type A sorting domain-containing protein [Crocinitomix catalasitica]
MKNALIFLILLSVGSTAKSQSYTVDFPLTYKMAPLGSVILINGTITNPDPVDTITAEMRLIDIDIAAPWNFQFCSPGGCQPPGVIADTFLVLPGQTADIYIEFLTSTAHYLGSINVIFNDMNAPFDTDSVVVSAETNGYLGLEYEEAINVIGQNYPNPFQSSTTIEYRIDTKSELFIYDAVGRLVQQLELLQEENYVMVSGLKAGTYTYMIETDEGLYISHRMTVLN